MLLLTSSILLAAFERGWSLEKLLYLLLWHVVSSWKFLFSITPFSWGETDKESGTLPYLLQCRENYSFISYISKYFVWILIRNKGNIYIWLPEKIQTGGGGVEDIKFLGVLKKKHCRNSRGQLKRKWIFQGVFKKN